jgi:hypothetical protein
LVASLGLVAVPANLSYGVRLDSAVILSRNKPVEEVRFMRRVASVVLAATAVGLLFGGYLLRSFNRPPFPLERLERLEPGMTAVQVREVLGEPDSVEGEADGAETWAYARTLSWPIVNVYFDSQGLFEEHVYDY